MLHGMAPLAFVQLDIVSSTEYVKLAQLEPLSTELNAQAQILWLLQLHADQIKFASIQHVFVLLDFTVLEVHVFPAQQTQHGTDFIAHVHAILLYGAWDSQTQSTLMAHAAANQDTFFPTEFVLNLHETFDYG
jgi:hypothetical protein